MNDMTSGMMGGMGLTFALVVISDLGGCSADQISLQGRLSMHRPVLAALATILMFSRVLAEQDAAARGERDFRACMPCHSLEPDRNMTGPSLAGVWGRKAGSLQSFERYSDALKSLGIIWDDRSLDAWLTDPDRMVPGNEMPFSGIKDGRAPVPICSRSSRKPRNPALGHSAMPRLRWAVWEARWAE